MMNKKQQQGSILLLAIMIILIFSVVGLAIVKTQETTGETIAQEVLGTRALMAARSGLEANLSNIFPLIEQTGDCNDQALTFNAPGLPNCTATVTCNVYATLNSINYYRVQSTGQCGTGAIEVNSTNIVLSSRTLQVEARTVERQ